VQNIIHARAHERARIGALSRSRPADDPELLDARRKLAEANISDYVERVLASAPPLSEEQRTRLAELLKPVRRAASSAEPAASRKTNGRKTGTSTNPRRGRGERATA
jgi:hypothetical protein